MELSRRLDDRTLWATFLNNLGMAQLKLGIAAALQCHREAMELAVTLNDAHVVAFVSQSLGGDYHADEKQPEAQAEYARALSLYDRLGQTGRHAGLRRLMQIFGYFAELPATG